MFVAPSEVPSKFYPPSKRKKCNLALAFGRMLNSALEGVNTGLNITLGVELFG